MPNDNRIAATPVQQDPIIFPDSFARRISKPWIDWFQTIFRAVEGPTIWNPLAFAAGWSNFGFGSTQGAYSRTGNTVKLRGFLLFAAAPWPVNSLIATLPEGFRPLAARVFVVWDAAGVSRIDVFANGQIVAAQTTAGALAGLGLSLESIEFTVD